MSALLSPSVARNRLPILSVLRAQIDSVLRPGCPTQLVRVLEVASGTGEHAAFFCSEIPYLVYQPTEPDKTMVDSINCWAANLMSENCSSTLLTPLSFSAGELLSNLSLLPPCMQAAEPSGAGVVDLVLCINMIHISPPSSTHDLLQVARTVLRPGGLLLLYGPFREGCTMVESNEAFDASLRSRDPAWGIRELAEVRAKAEGAGFTPVLREEMPANNLCVAFQMT